MTEIGLWPRRYLASVFVLLVVKSKYFIVLCGFRLLMISPKHIDCPEMSDLVVLAESQSFPEYENGDKISKLHPSPGDQQWQHWLCGMSLNRSLSSARSNSTACAHDDVIKWKHFPRYWPFVRGIHRSPVNSPNKGQWRGALMFSLIYALNKRLGKQSWGWWFETTSRPLWRHCNKYRCRVRKTIQCVEGKLYCHPVYPLHSRHNGRDDVSQITSLTIVYSTVYSGADRGGGGMHRSPMAPVTNGFPSPLTEGQ